LVRTHNPYSLRGRLNQTSYWLLIAIMIGTNWQTGRGHAHQNRWEEAPLAEKTVESDVLYNSIPHPFFENADKGTF
jgi:hypothetical protein